MEALLALGAMLAVSVLALEFSYDSRDDARMLRAIGHGLSLPGTSAEAARALETNYAAWRDARAASAETQPATSRPAA